MPVAGAARAVAGALFVPVSVLLSSGALVRPSNVDYGVDCITSVLRFSEQSWGGRLCSAVREYIHQLCILFVVFQPADQQ